MILKNTQKTLSGLIISIMSAITYAQTPIAYDQANSFETGGPIPHVSLAKDLNSDGHMDLLISSEGKLHFLMGDGTGVLEERANFRLNTNTRLGAPVTVGLSATLGDFDGDGSLDIAIATNTPSPTQWYNNYVKDTRTISIYLNDGTLDPSYTKVSSLPYDGVSNRFRSEDFNDDGLADLMVNGYILLSEGDGNFLETDNIIISSYYQENISGTYTADINNDGIIDIIYAGLSVNYCGNGDGTFFECYESPVPTKANLTDFNNDGLIDQVAIKIVSYKKIPYTSYQGGGCGTRYLGGHRSGGTICFRGYTVTRYRFEPETSQLLVRLQNIDGTFDEIYSPIINDVITQIKTIDMDNDSLTDVAVQLQNQSGISILRGLGNGELSPVESIPGTPSVLSFGDFNEDGLPDIIYVGLSIANKPDSDAWAFLQLQSNSTGNTSSVTGSTTTNAPAAPNNTPTPTNNVPTGTNAGSSGNSNFPAIDPNGETIELAGTISELYSDHLVVQGTTIWFDASASFKYEPGFNLEVGESAQLEANPNIDGSGTAIKVQIGPL